MSYRNKCKEIGLGDLPIYLKFSDSNHSAKAQQQKLTFRNIC